MLTKQLVWNGLSVSRHALHMTIIMKNICICYTCGVVHCVVLPYIITGDILMAGHMIIKRESGNYVNLYYWHSVIKLLSWVLLFCWSQPVYFNSLQFFILFRYRRSLILSSNFTFPVTLVRFWIMIAWSKQVTYCKSNL